MIVNVYKLNRINMSLGFAQRIYVSFFLIISFLLTIEAKGCSSPRQNTFGKVNGSVHFSFLYNGSHSYNHVSIRNDDGYRLMDIFYPFDDSFGVLHMSERINFTGNVTSGDFSFILNDLQTPDSGTYTLTGYPTAVETCFTLYILGKPTVPVISYTLPTTVTVASVLDLHCMSNSTTVPPGLPLTYTWLRNSESISRDRRFTVSGPMLTIHYVVKEDESAELSCVAMEKMNISTESDPTRIKVFNTASEECNSREVIIITTGSTIGVIGAIAALVTIGVVLHRRQINAKSSPSTNRQIDITQDQGVAYEDLFIVQPQTQQYEAIQMAPQVLEGDVVSSDQGDGHLYTNVQE